MNEENELIYFKSGLALGVGLGLVGGIASTLPLNAHKKAISAAMHDCARNSKKLLF